MYSFSQVENLISAIIITLCESMKLPGWNFFCVFLNLMPFLILLPVLYVPLVTHSMFFLKEKKSISCIMLYYRMDFLLFFHVYCIFILPFTEILGILGEGVVFNTTLKLSFYKIFNKFHYKIPKLLLNRIVAVCLFFMPSNEIYSLLVKSFWTK